MRLVVVCAGAYRRPAPGPSLTTLPPGVLGIDGAGYRHPSALPPGRCW